MCAAPQREPNSENDPPSILVTVANFQLEDHKRQRSLRRKPYLEKEPPSIRGTVANFQLEEHKWRGSLRREPHFENGPPSILVIVGHFKLWGDKLQGSLRRNARPARKYSLGVGRGGVIYQSEGARTVIHCPWVRG